MKIISWILVIVAVIIMIIAFLDWIIAGQIFKVKQLVSYFHIANSFLLLALCTKFICTCKKKE